MRERPADGPITPESLSVVFQTLFEVGAHGTFIHAVEALVRGRSAGLESPAALFEHARERGEEGALDGACLAAILGEARLLPADLRLCVNVQASTLAADASFVARLALAARECCITAERLVVDIVDHAPFLGGAAFQESVGQLREAGMRIAVDDLGLSHSNYRTMIECRPDYLKLDVLFLAGAAQGRAHEAVLDSVCALSWKFGARVVAKGIESRAALAAVTAAGIDLVQGFLLAPPLGFDQGAARTISEPAACHDHGHPGALAPALPAGAR